MNSRHLQGVSVGCKYYPASPGLEFTVIENFEIFENFENFEIFENSRGGCGAKI